MDCPNHGSNDKKNNISNARTKKLSKPSGIGLLHWSMILTLLTKQISHKTCNVGILVLVSWLSVVMSYGSYFLRACLKSIIVLKTFQNGLRQLKWVEIKILRHHCTCQTYCPLIRRIALLHLNICEFRTVDLDSIKYVKQYAANFHIMFALACSCLFHKLNVTETL